MASSSERSPRLHPADARRLALTAGAEALAVTFVATHAGSLALAASGWLGGLAAWTLLEYALHRVLFHLPADHPLDAAGARMHRAHHAEPAPPIVKPPAATLGALFTGFALSAAVLGAARVAPLWAGVLMGYLVYEVAHLAAHLLDEARHPWPAQRARHLLHHRSPGACFGITSPLWDAVFGSLSEERR